MTRDDNPVRMVRELAGTPDQIFGAWTRPAIMRQWLFAGPHSQIVDIEVNLRKGGTFSILEQPDDGAPFIDHYGRYLTVKSPRRLVFTLQVPAHFPETTRVEIEIAPTPHGSRLKFVQTGIQASIVQPAWEHMLGTLHHLTAGGQRIPDAP